jgi:hypothetical protein
VATLGRFKAIVGVKGIRLSGFPGWLVWMFVHLAFLTGFGNRFSTMLRWLRSMIGRSRAERDFSTAHTGGDLSLPDEVRTQVEPTRFPVVEQTGWRGTPGPSETGGEHGRPSPSPDQHG